MRLRFTALCLICASLVLCAVLSARAQSLGIDPLLVERTVSPGSSFSYTVNIQNEDRFEPITLAVSVMDIQESLSGVYNLIEARTTSYSITDWVTFQPSVLTIPPASEGHINVAISVPRGVSGGRYGAVVVSPNQDVSDQGSTSSAIPFTFRMASYIELTIAAGTLQREAHISNFSLQPSCEWPAFRRMVGDEALVFTAEVSNVGNVHVVTRGTISIQTEEGRMVARFPLGGGRGVILPDSTVALQSVLRRALTPGKYTARAIIEYGGRRPAVSEISFTITESDIQAQEASAEPLAHFTVDPEEIGVIVRPGALSNTILESPTVDLSPSR